MVSQLVPPSVVLLALPVVLTKNPVFASINADPLIAPVPTLEVCGVQVAPPSVVFEISPVDPKIQPVLASTKFTLLMVKVIPVAIESQLAPAFVVFLSRPVVPAMNPVVEFIIEIQLKVAVEPVTGSTVQEAPRLVLIIT